MSLRSKGNYSGVLGTGILLAAIFLGLTCHAGAAEFYGKPPDRAAVRDCLSRAMETAPSGTTVDELRAQCQADEMPDADIEEDPLLGEYYTDYQDESIVLPFFKSLDDEEDKDLLAGRIYTDNQNVLRPFTLMAHRPNYFLFACYNNSPNEEGVYDQYGGDEVNVDKTESQFQVSIKVPLAIDLFDGKMDIYSGYTVRSYWQVYNSDLSAFFRETNYSPEAWVKVHSGWSLWGVKNVANRFGFVHQSNGRDEPISRSWNRIFAKFQFEKGNLVFWIKPWIRVPEEDSKDNNKDITDYYGHGEIQAIYKWHRNVFSVMSRNNLESGFKKGAVEATWSFPLWHYKYLKGYVQGFTGYSHSLIDYDSNETTIGIGVAVTDYL